MCIVHINIVRVCDDICLKVVFNEDFILNIVIISILVTYGTSIHSMTGYGFGLESTLTIISRCRVIVPVIIIFHVVSNRPAIIQPGRIISRNIYVELRRLAIFCIGFNRIVWIVRILLNHKMVQLHVKLSVNSFISVADRTADSIVTITRCKCIAGGRTDRLLILLKHVHVIPRISDRVL